MRYGQYKQCSRVNGGVKESTSCVQEFMGALRRAQAVFKSYGGVQESTSCVQELMGVLRRAQAVFKS